MSATITPNSVRRSVMAPCSIGSGGSKPSGRAKAAKPRAITTMGSEKGLSAKRRGSIDDASTASPITISRTS